MIRELFLLVCACALLAMQPAAAQDDAGNTAQQATEVELDLDAVELDLDKTNWDEAQLSAEPGMSSTPVNPDGGELDLGNIAVNTTRSLQTLLGDSRALAIISGDALAAAKGLDEVLERLPGVDVRSAGGAGQLAGLQLRGASSQQVLVLIDSAPLAQGPADLALVPVGAVAQIELLRGPQASRFGPGAQGGVLNVVTIAPLPVEQEPDWQQRYAESGLSYKEVHSQQLAWQQREKPAPVQSFRTLGGGHSLLQTDYTYQDTSTALHLSHMRARNNFSYERVGGDTGTRRNNDAAQQQFSYAWRDGGTLLRAGLLHSRRGVPGSAEQPTPLAQLARDRFSFSAQAGSWTGSLSAMHSRFTDPEPFLGGAPIASEDWQLQAQAASGSLATQRGSWGIKPHLSYIDSADWGQHLRLGADIHHYREWQHGAQLWQLDLGVTVASDQGALPAGRLGWSRPAGSSGSIFAALGYAVRYPTFNELYYLDTGGVRGNPGLDPEQVASIEAGWRFSRASTELELGAFYSEYYDSIIWAPASSYLVEASNTGEAQVAGTELLLNQRLAECWWWRSAYTWLPLAEYGSGTPLTGRSEHHLSSNLQYAAAPWQLTLECDYTSSAPADLLGSLHVPARTLWHMSLGFETEAAAYRVQGRNLLNASARDSWNYPLPGREVLVSVEWTF